MNNKGDFHRLIFASRLRRAKARSVILASARRSRVALISHRLYFSRDLTNDFLHMNSAGIASYEPSGTRHPIAQTVQIMEMRLQEIQLLQEYRQELEAILAIPHLPVDIDFDLERVRAEAHAVPTDHPHLLHPDKNLPDWYLQNHKRSFRGRCLVDYRPDGEISGMSDAPYHLFDESDAQFDEQGRQRFFITAAGTRMPYTLQSLRRISPYINRTRLIRTPPGGGIHWHTHHNGLYEISYPRLCIFNMPLAGNSRCVHRVRDYREPAAKSHRSRYEPGRVYLFNSWHEHDFWNQGDSDRLVVIPYFNFGDRELLQFLCEQASRYTGPRLAPDPLAERLAQAKNLTEERLQQSHLAAMQ